VRFWTAIILLWIIIPYQEIRFLLNTKWNLFCRRFWIPNLSGEYRLVPRVKFTIPGPDSVDWFVFDAEDRDFFEEYEKYKEFVHVEKITYTDVECDTIREY
jgi:hypothetical protein